MERAVTTKIVRGWPELWASFKALMGIFSQVIRQSVGPNCETLGKSRDLGQPQVLFSLMEPVPWMWAGEIEGGDPKVPRRRADRHRCPLHEVVWPLSFPLSC